MKMFDQFFFFYQVKNNVALVITIPDTVYTPPSRGKVAMTNGIRSTSLPGGEHGRWTVVESLLRTDSLELAQTFM